MRRVNRQIKMTLDIPAKYEDDEAFMVAFMDVLDNTDWALSLEVEDGRTISATVHRVQMGDVVIEPEEES